MTATPRDGLNSSIALARIRQMVDGGISAGARLPTERALAAEIGVGRAAVRRALEALEAEGLIWRRQGKGTFVVQPPRAPGLAGSLAAATNPAEVAEARITLEPQLARLSALNATPEDVARMRQLAERIAASTDADARELWDGALHRLIARTAGNGLLLAVFDLMEEVRRDDVWRMLRERARTRGTLALYARQHAAIIDAIARRDGAGAEGAMRSHLRTVAENLRRIVDGDAPDADTDGDSPAAMPEPTEGAALAR
ncbi:FadR family transcriptional regulator [Limibaculum sp. FT325]|uniref:FadR/GntR family transcriptional regulator n=1 Tax=Thermohalobaculum sediminis TaxID=2939436 RepID=UPI0020C16521|nr:FadR/GntR family transcriptional regulator [Limibaculum sediminis]MCL5778394.1 FadR family transcriptional regulator [Limibaculum sediminis]